MYTIILVNNHPWRNDKPSSRIFLTREWIRKHHVVYVDPPVTIWQLIKNIWRHFSKETLNCPWDIHHENLFIFRFYQIFPINWLPHGRLYLWLNGWFNKLGGYCLQRFLVKRGIHQSKVIQINAYWPCFKPEISKDLLVYYSTDLMTDGYMLKHAAKMEDEFVQKADMVVSTSSKLQERHAKNNKFSFLVTNGVDLNQFGSERFKQDQEPEALNGITRPRIIFTGNDQYQPRLDEKLIRFLCAERPQYNYVFAGHYHPLLLKLFNEYKNIHYLGPIAVNKIEHYLNYVDVGMIPYKQNGLTAHIYPLKVNEYLACGLPVVCTDFSRDLTSFGHLIERATTYSEFAECLDKAITDHSAKAQRVEFARHCGWDFKADEFIRLLERQMQL